MYFGACLFVIHGWGYAETMYVTDSIKLTLRTGQSTEHKIIAVIDSGQELEVLESGDEWSLVRLPNGKEGWVLTRYLTPDPTNNIKLEKLAEKHNNLMAETSTLLEENTKLKAENNMLSGTVTVKDKDLSQTQSEYEALKKDSAEFLSLKTRYEKTASQLAEKAQKLEKLEDQISRFELHHYIRWFLAGSGVLLVGFLIGFSAKRQRRRSSLL